MSGFVDPFEGEFVDPFEGSAKFVDPFEEEEEFTLQDVINPVREFAQGASYAFADEAEAGVRSLVDKLQGNAFEGEADVVQTRKDLGYGDFKEEINQEREEYAEENPVAAIGLEILGGVMAGGAVARSLGTAKTVAGTAKIQGAAGAAEAGLYGLGTGDTVEERIQNAGVGIIAGGLLGSAAGAAFKHVGNKMEAKRKIVARELKKTADADKNTVIQQKMYQNKLAAVAKGKKGEHDLKGSPLQQAIQAGEELGIDANEVIRLGKLSKGFPDLSNVSAKELTEGSVGLLKQTAQEKARVALNKNSGFKYQFDSLLSPIKRMIKDQVGDAPAALTNRAQNRALVQTAKFHDGVGDKVKEIRKFMDGDDMDAIYLKEKFLNAALGDEDNANLARKFIAKKWGDEGVQALDGYMAEVEKLAGRWHKSVDAESPVTKHWLHTQKKGKPKPGVRTASVQNTVADFASRKRTRGILMGDPDAVREYANPLRSMDDWVDDHVAAINTAELFNIRPAGRIDMKPVPEKVRERGPAAIEKWKKTQRAKDRKALERGERGGYVGRALAEKLKQEGYNEGQQNSMRELTHHVLYDAQRAPSQLVRSIRDLGYSGTIFNPYGAILNLHDIFNAASKMGMRNAIASIFSSSPIKVKDAGLARQYMGEYNKTLESMNPGKFNKMMRSTAWLAEASSKVSGFRKLDGFGKTKIMNMALREAKDTIKKGDFDEVWGNTFTPTERLQIRKDLANGEASDLVRELAMFRLSELQPINPAQQTRLQLSHPNWRIAYMLKSFAIRQMDFLRKNTVDEWNKGNRAKAAAFAARYALYSGGGFALTNESRQYAKGEEGDFSPENLAEQAGRQMVNVVTFGAAGNSDYAWEKFWQNPTEAWKTGLLPPTNLIEAAWADAAGMLAPIAGGDFEEPKELLKNMPVFGKTFFKPMLEADDD